MLIDSRRGVKIGVPEGRAAIAVPTPKPAPGTAFPPRRLTLHGADVFELSLWCGTCPAVLRKLAEPDAADVELANLSLAAGVPRIDADVVRAYGKVLPESTYTVLLLEMRPQLITPGGEQDYFIEEQVVTWGVDPLVGSGEPAGSPYYRSFQTPIDNPDDVYDEAARRFSQEELAGLITVITVINGWNRIAVTTQLEPGHYQPGDH